MENNFDVCKFEDKEDKLSYEVIVEGKIIRGWDLETNPDLLKYLSDAKRHSTNKLIIINLAKLEFWDTKGIQLIIEAILAINKVNSKRAGIIGPADPAIKDVGKVKYPAVGTELVPWENSRDELIKFLTA